MPNQITAAGLETKTLDEIVTYLKTQFQTIYGADINVDSDTPDGQLINILAQAAVDNLELLTQIYNTFTPDQAIGATLDQRCALNGVKRKGGTYTITNVSITVDRALNLVGLDGAVLDPNGTGFTVQDNAGNQFILITSQTIGSPGTYSFAFRAKVAGAVLTTPNTIQIPVTIVLGVTSINNPSSYTTLGINQETDAQLRLRRQQSVTLSSQGYLAGLLSSLLNIDTVTSAFVYENNTGSPDSDAIPGHSIWVIVQGGLDADIAKAIYSKRNAGCGMKGLVSVIITQADGTPFVILFDRTSTEDLFIQAHIGSINGIDTPDLTYIKNQLVLRLKPGINQGVNINELSTIVQEIDPNALVVPTSGDGFSLMASGYTNILNPSAKNKQFLLDAANMDLIAV
jgi:uncharacterized phage protein gp47/JayE